MKRLDYLLLFLLSLLILSLVGYFQTSPGYMDADYYFAGGTLLAENQGLNEPFIWNYLDNPQSVPHPAFTYWMPLAALISAASMVFTQRVDFASARIGFLLLAASIAPMTAYLSYRLNRTRWGALISGVLAIVAGFYLAYLPTTDTFAVYMLLGTLLLLLAIPQENPPIRLRWFLIPWLAGILAGLMNLARADGILWLGFAIIVMILLPDPHGFGRRFRPAGILYKSIACVIGYFAILGPWMYRNWIYFGTWFSPAGSRVLWLRNYDELYIYPASILTWEHWIRQGIRAILISRAYAFGQNMQTLIAVQGGIFLLPLIALGLWKLRRERIVQVGLFAWVLTFAIMTFLFPFQGARGGFFHSGAALQPLFWAAVPAGLEVFIAWGVKVRGWKQGQARMIFGSGFLLLSVLLTIFIIRGRVIGAQKLGSVWNQPEQSYEQIESHLIEAGVPLNQGVLVNNPPGYYLASHRQSIAIPDGDVQTVLAVGQRYGTCILILEANHPAGIDRLYKAPEEFSQFEKLLPLGETQILRIRDCSAKA
jgi:hypothetical protein